jgi:tuberculosinol/isotuberculosinol synthase
MIFAHGIDTILTPLFGSELLGRGSAYSQYVLSGLSQLADDEVYQEMFAAGVRIRFYGDYEEMLDAPIFRPTLEACASLAAATASGNGPTLLIGLFADSPHATLARLSVEFAQRWGRPPDRRELIEAYYGLAVPDLSIYLGFAQPVLFDIPLLATGQEDLYVTLNPSPSLTEKQLREILYDHLVTRRVPEVDYDKLPDEAQDALAEYYKRCSGVTMGIGLIDPLTGVWKPLPSAPTEKRQGDPGVPRWAIP